MLLIKCADINNVARHHDTALQWMYILSEEFSRQAFMEDELEIKSSLLAAPKKDMMSLASAQLGFMNMFAIPLFQGVADMIPTMRYTVEELEVKGLFEHKVQEERAKQARDDGEGTQLRRMSTGTFSPKTRSPSHGADGGDNNDGKSTLQAGKPKTTTDEAPEGHGEVPQISGDARRRDNRRLSPPALGKPPARPCSALFASGDYKAMDGAASSFDAVRELADSDPFHCRARGDSGADSRVSMPSGRQRCSEMTECSASGAFAGDWQSQATSATTGKAALSPSTKGTSIVSNESMEHAASASGPNATPPSMSNQGSPVTVHRHDGQGDEEPAPAGTTAKAEGKSLKKRPSRFRMKDFPFFRRNKGSSPSLLTADATN